MGNEVVNPEIELEQKKRFAVELLKDPTAAFKIAQGIFGDDTGKALFASSRWPFDPVVLELRRLALEEMGDMHFLPTKADAARAAWSIANNQTLTVDDRLKGLRLYSDIRGFIDKGSIINNNNNAVISNNVMVVKSSGTTEEWESRLAAQQNQLIIDADSTH